MLGWLMRGLRGGAGFGVIVEEVLHEQDYGDLARWVEAQPPWSDFPVIILARRGGDVERNPAVARFTRALGNVTFLERPFHPTTLVSVAQTAMRGRRRQYEARGQMRALNRAKLAYDVGISVVTHRSRAREPIVAAFLDDLKHAQ